MALKAVAASALLSWAGGQRTGHAIFLSSDSYRAEEQKADRKRFPLLLPSLQIFLVPDLFQKKGRACFLNVLC